MSKVFLSLACTVALFAATNIVNAADHYCPQCGRVVSSNVTVSHAQPTISYAQPVSSYVQPATSYAQPVSYQPVVQQTYAQPVYQQPVYQQPVHQQATSHGQSYGGGQSYGSGSGYAHAVRSANYRAAHGIKGHAMTAGYTEGVGFSTRSAQDAIRQCCYSNSGMRRQVSVVRGRDGWYATSVYNR